MSRLLFDEDKPAHRSKSVWVGLLSSMVLFIPQVGAFVAKHPEAYGIINGLIIIGLRYVTKVPLR